MIISAIAAVASNGVIGKDNDLVWNLPADMRFFKETTTGHFVIMGRKNYDSIPEKYRPLPNRENVIVTRQKNLKVLGSHIVHSVEEGIKLAEKKGEKEAFIIGGGEIFSYALKNNLPDRLYITHIHQSFDGDAYFPEFDLRNWDEIIIKE